VTDDLTFFDLESTGTDPAADRITAVGVVFPDGTTFRTLVNPGRPIPPAVQELTGITDAMVAEAPPFAELAHGLAVMLADGRPLGGFGLLHFDLPLLAEEFERCGQAYQFGPAVDAGALFKVAHPRTLGAAVRHYLGRPHEKAHDALTDAAEARRVYSAMRTVEPAFAGLTAAELAAVSGQNRPPADPFGKLVLIDGVVCFGTHRNRGVPVADDPGYAEWMLRSDFPLATKRVLRAELARLGAAADAEREEPTRAAAANFGRPGPGDAAVPF
jgi:DNA polymerase III subunit epsilon